MSNIQIPNLPVAIALNGTEQFEAVQGGSSVRVTTSQMFAFATGLTPPFSVPLGGTGQTTFTQYGLIYGNGVSALQQVGLGTTGQILVGNTGAAPTWSALTGVAVTSLSFAATGLTPNVATQGAIVVGGTLVVANGGTGVATFTSHGVVYGNGASALQVTAEGATGTVLVGTTGGVPSFSALSGLAVTSIAFGTTGLTPSAATKGVITVAGTLVVANGGTGVATFTQNGVLYGNTAGNILVTAQGAANTILIANGGAPSFSATPVIGTSVTVPLVVGGTAAGSSLTLQSTSGAGTTDTILFKVGNNGAVTAATMASATAFLLMGAGTTTIAPFKLTSGTNLTTAAAGAIEYDGSAMYFSPAASTRSTVVSRQIMYLGTAYTLTNATGVQKLFNGSANGAVTLPVGDYEFECYVTISALPGTGTFGFAMAGAATYTQAWEATGARVAAGTAATPSVSFNTAANTAVTPTSATTTAYMKIRGTINVTGAGTVIPQFSMTTTSAAAVIGVGSYFIVAPFSGTNGVTNVAIGNWS